MVSPYMTCDNGLVLKGKVGLALNVAGVAERSCRSLPGFSAASRWDRCWALDHPHPRSGLRQLHRGSIINVDLASSSPLHCRPITTGAITHVGGCRAERAANIIPSHLGKPPGLTDHPHESGSTSPLDRGMCSAGVAFADEGEVLG